MSPGSNGRQFGLWSEQPPRTTNPQPRARTVPSKVPPEASPDPDPRRSATDSVRRTSAFPFDIRTSYRLETLASRLAEEMRQKPLEPLEPERIVVPDPLIGQWLRLQLASRLDVAAHLRIEQPAEFAWAAMRDALDDLDHKSVYGPPYLRWRVFDRLSTWEGEDDVAKYLADGEPRKRFGLADRLARAYDRCRLFRPQSIRDWQQGRSGDWHARLWADLSAGDNAPQHWVDAIDRYRDALGKGQASAQRRRVSFFHVTGLSPTYVEFLRLVAGVVDLHLYMWRPTRSFWSAPAPPKVGGYYEEHCELVEGWGRSSRDQQELILGGAYGTPIDTRDDDGEPGPNGTVWLHHVQRDILGVAGTADPNVDPPGSPDASLQVHVCHSPTREVEVLHDRLLGLFDRNCDLQPADVLIVTPEIDTYAPLIEAVFGAANEIRFDIGRQRLKEGAALTAFLDLLDLPGSRYGATATLAPLAAAPVRGHFGIDGPSLELLRDAVTRAGVRWGRDAEHRAELDTPAPPNHNWRHGLRRLLLGYGMEEGDVLIGGATPSGLDRWGFHVGANDYELFGRLARFAEFAFGLDGWVEEEHTPDDWAVRLRGDVLDQFFQVPSSLGADAAREVFTVDRLIDEFANECADAGADEPVPFAVVRDVLRQKAEESARAAPRLADGVTVSELRSGRFYPARVICVVGMNDHAFPRRLPAPPFGFLADLFEGEARQAGDRLPGDEDRLAFLEAVLSARDSFVVTYTGRDLMEDKEIPPSVVVSELLEYLASRLPAAPAPQASDPQPFQTAHPLQPFSRRYFSERADRDGDSETGLFSYAQPMAETAAVSERAGEAPRRFEGELAVRGEDAPGGSATEVELDELIRFAHSPSKHFATNRLGLKLDRRRDELADDEPLTLDNLQSWQLKDSLAERTGQSEERSAAWSAASGLLPPSNLGEITQKAIAEEWQRLEEALAPYAEHRSATIRTFDLDLGGQRLLGAVKGYDEAAGELLWWRVGRLRPKDELDAWLRLLAVSCATGRPVNAKLFGIAGDVQEQALQGPPPDEARAFLEHWLKAWKDGRTRPIPFFAETSAAWLDKANDKANEAALSAWTSAYGEGKDACHALIFGEDPTGEEFETLAKDLLAPLLEAKG